MQRSGWEEATIHHLSCVQMILPVSCAPTYLESVSACTSYVIDMHTAFVVHLLAKLAASGRVILCSVSKTINRYLFMFKVLLTTALLTLHC